MHILDASYIFSYVVEQIPKYNSYETVVPLELTYNGVAICICMYVATEEKNPALHAYILMFS